MMILKGYVSYVACGTLENLPNLQLYLPIYSPIYLELLVSKD